MASVIVIVPLGPAGMGLSWCGSCVTFERGWWWPCLVSRYPSLLRRTSRTGCASTPVIKHSLVCISTSANDIVCFVEGVSARVTGTLDVQWSHIEISSLTSISECTPMSVLSCGYFDIPSRAVGLGAFLSHSQGIFGSYIRLSCWLLRCDTRCSPSSHMFLLLSSLVEASD